MVLVYYAVTDMGCFDDYLDDTPRSKKMRGMVLLPFFCMLPNVPFLIKNVVTATLIAESLFKSLYSRLGFKVIKYFAASPNFEKSRKQFNYESVKSNAL